MKRIRTKTGFADILKEGDGLYHYYIAQRSANGPKLVRSGTAPTEQLAIIAVQRWLEAIAEPAVPDTDINDPVID